MEVQPQVIDVDQTNFEEIVLSGSKERVMVVDFWAPWCGPCRTLGPILEEVVTGLGPGVALAKINVDENAQLAAAFQVQGIPAVKIVKDGQLAQEFTGALPREQIESLLKPLVDHIPEADAAEDLCERAENLVALDDLEGAGRCYNQRLDEQPDDTRAITGLARVCLQQSNYDAVRELVARVDQTDKEYDTAQALLKQIEFHMTCAEAGGRESCASKMLAHSDDVDVRYHFGCCAAADGDFATALDEWLAIIQEDRDHTAAKEAMVAVFHLLGRNSEVVGEYPRLLHRALY